MLNFLKKIFSRDKSEEDEYLDFSDYTDVSIDLRNVRNKNDLPVFEDKSILKANPIPKENEPVIPDHFKTKVKFNNTENMNRDDVETEIDTRKVQAVFTPQKNSDVSPTREVRNHFEGQKRKNQKGVVEALEDEGNFNGDYATVQFKVDKVKKEKKRKPLFMLLFFLLCILLFLTFERNTEDPEVETVDEFEEEILEDEIVQEPTPVKVNFLATGSGLVYNCVKGHWACLDKFNYEKCGQLASKRKCFAIKTYKSKTICQKVQQKSVDLNRKVKACR